MENKKLSSSKTAVSPKKAGVSPKKAGVSPKKAGVSPKKTGAPSKKLRLRAEELSLRLSRLYPSAECALEFEGEPWKLLVMGRLSAQCTDVCVNKVSKVLFSRFPGAEALAEADPRDVEEIIRPCGLFRVKASDIINECRMLTVEYGGSLPSEMDDLLRFPGVGRKIANLLLGDVFHKGGIVADTHCIRICGRLGMYPAESKDPLRTERVMSALIPLEEQSDFCHRIVNFGREYCSARNPRCSECPMSDICPSAKASDK